MPNFSAFMAVNEDAWDTPEEEEEDQIEVEDEVSEINKSEEDPRGKSKFNFSGMSFKDYVRSIQEELNDELRILVNAFI